ncbi:MAG: methyltransferase domain-containing protein [Candidatus Shapirobacteria bacterium]
MSKQPLVSIIILNYNGEDFICSCVNSVLKTDYPNFEIILIENGSTDNSYQLIKRKYGKNKKVNKFVSDKIKIIRSKENLFFAGGSNLGAFYSKGEKLFFLNSDAIVDKDWAKELIAFTKNKEKYLIQPKILFFQKKRIIDNVGGNYNFFGLGSGKGRGEKDLGQYDQSVRVDYANGTCFLIDRNFFFNLGGFDEWFKYHYEDIDLNLRAKKQGGQSWYCPKSIIYHQGSLTVKSQLTSQELLFNIRKNRLRTIIKNFKGPKKVLKITGFLLISFALAIQDLLTFKPARMFLTLKSLKANIERELKTSFDKFRLWELKRFVSLKTSLLSKKNSLSLLDLGCGDGSFLNLALKNNFNVLAVDQVPKINLKIIHSSIENLNLSKKFEVVTAFHFLEHTKDPEKVLRKAKGFLKKDGVLIIEIPLTGNLTERFLRKDYFAYQSKAHLNFFTKQKIINLLNQAGFKIEKKGFALHQLPFTVLTTSFKKGIFSSLKGLILFLPFKIFSALGLNDEILRVYCTIEKDTV